LLPDGAERLRGGLVTPNFFETLGVAASRGRTFNSRDQEGEPLVVISDGYCAASSAAILISSAGRLTCS